MRCKSGHDHQTEFGRRICDATIPPSGTPEGLVYRPTPRWLNRAAKDLTGNLRSN